MRNYIEWEKKTHFIFPIDGDVLNRYDGEVRDGKLYVKARVESDSPVRINGVLAEKCDDYYVAEVCIGEGKTVLVQKSAAGTERCRTAFRLTPNGTLEVI